MVCQKDLANVVSPSGLLASIARALAQSILAMVCASVAILTGWQLMRGIVCFLKGHFATIWFNWKQSFNTDATPCSLAFFFVLNFANLNNIWINRSFASAFDLVEVTKRRSPFFFTKPTRTNCDPASAIILRMSSCFGVGFAMGWVPVGVCLH